MSRTLTKTEQILGPRPGVTLVIENRYVTEIWVAGRAPYITIRDYDWGQTDLHPAIDAEGYPFTPIRWRGAAWQLGLSFHPPIKEEIPMAHPTLKTIPLSALHISPLNMRHGKRAPDVSDILPSVKTRGILQTLLVRKEGAGFGVVAGRRRWFAAQAAANEDSTDPRIPCYVLGADDDAAAIEASLLENVARVPASEIEQYRAFGALARQGKEAIDIAEQFGVTPHTVNRILALAALLPAILRLYEKEELDSRTIRALTLATKLQQKEWLRLWKSDTERAPTGNNCKAWVTGGKTITTDVALFDLEAYDGQIIADLFGDHGVFADPVHFWAAQSRAIAEHVAAYEETGWKGVTLLDRGSYFHSWEHTKRARTKGGHVFVEIRHDGQVTFHEGYITNAEAKREAAQDTTDKDAPPAIKPEMSGPVAEYILRHRHSAARASLLQSPAIALRLMVAHALVGSSLWDVRPQGNLCRKDATRDSVDASRGEAEMSAASERVSALFKALGVPHLRRSNNGETHLCEVFAALLAMCDEEVEEVLAFTMANTLAGGGPLVEAVAHVTGTDMAAYWKPDPAFFDVLRDKRAINAMVAEIASPSTAESCLTDTAAVQKEIIANRITGEGCEANKDWRPVWMQMPPSRYVDGAPSFAADAWEKVAALFAPDGPDLEAETEQEDPQ